MSRTYTQRFRVRPIECDALGYVHHTVFMRYLQEAAINASADVGYSRARCAELGVNWLIRRSRIDYFQLARDGDTLDVTTYVAYFRGARLQRHSEIARSGDGICLARAATNWMFINRRSGVPAPIPNDLVSAFQPEESNPNARARLDAIHLPNMPPPDAHHMTQRVSYSDLDQDQRVNNAVYLNYLDQATIGALASAGFDVPQLLELGGLFAVRQHDIEYLHPAEYGDTLRIATWIGELASSGVLRYYTMRDQDGELAVRAQTQWGWVDPASRQPMPIPAALLDALTPLRLRESKSKSEATAASESGESIKLELFLLWKGQANSEDQAKQLILDGRVRVDRQVETRPRRRLLDGDTVAVGGKTFSVDLSELREFVKLKQFLIWRRMARTPTQSERLIRSGVVRVNGQVETRRVRRLFHGFSVTIGDKTYTVDLSQPYRFIKLDQFLHRQGIFKATKIIRTGALRVNGQIELNAKRRLFSGDAVTVAGKLSEDDLVVGDREFKVDLSEDAADLYDEE